MIVVLIVIYFYCWWFNNNRINNVGINILVKMGFKILLFWIVLLSLGKELFIKCIGYWGKLKI